MAKFLLDFDDKQLNIENPSDKYKWPVDTYKQVTCFKNFKALK